MDKFDITELTYLFYDLSSILKNDRSKHRAKITASKAAIYPILDRMCNIILSYNEQPNLCSKCPLFEREESIHMANETINRLRRYAKHEPCPIISESEAENLHKIFDGLH